VAYGTIKRMIVGIDEVGRGAWAGPLVVGAVLLGGAKIDGLTDSKLLTKKQREELDGEIRKQAAAIGLGWVSAPHIDELGLTAALKLASRRALAHIRRDYKEIIIDGTISFIDDSRVTLMKKADLLVPSVSAASIVAKVARDNYMTHLSQLFPDYKFHSHVGYGTAAHRDAVHIHGLTPLHRRSWASSTVYGPELARARDMTTKQIGDRAESEAVRHLGTLGHRIVARNWRTRYCEIDIVSECGDTIYFTEVKYRRTARQGGGMAAITAKKQRQMTFAAELYAAKNKLQNRNLRLAAASVSGQPPVLQEFLELM
jgi:ribonuclease HII